MYIAFTSPTRDNLNFQICNYISKWHEVGGIYMFCRFNRFALLNGLNGFEPLYIGKTNNFKIRLPTHEKWEESVQLGAVKVLAAVEESESRRSLLEFQLIQYFDPPINKQLRPLPNNLELGIAPKMQQNPADIWMGLAQQTHQHPVGIGMSLAPKASQKPMGVLGMSLVPETPQKPMGLLGMGLVPETPQKPMGLLGMGLVLKTS